MTEAPSDPRRAAERAARTSYGRLLAFLSARTRDVAAAEDALAEAFRAALETWPIRGVPDKPEAWLLTAARRTLIDAARRAATRSHATEALLDALAEAEEERMAAASRDIPDTRLALLFVCAHPQIDPGARTPLMLQTVFGLDAARIAGAFLTSPATMGQRLVRAKARIRDAGLRFEVPGPEAWGERLAAVLEAVYAAYGTGWDDVSGSDPRRAGLAGEAIDLARLLVDLLPGEPEALGLLALVLHCEARRDARRDAAGGFVALAEQDTALWSQPLQREAEEALRRAAALGRPGRFQTEAAIQSVHAMRARAGTTDWPMVAMLHDALLVFALGIGARVSHAAAHAEASGPVAGLRLLDALPQDAVRSYQPYWALRAHLLARSGAVEEARAAFGLAIGLSEDPAVRDFLRTRCP
ncbi:RNA polymerase sigma factor [Alsobacter sp. R-9]